jgi:hypothetical protein
VLALVALVAAPLQAVAAGAGASASTSASVPVDPGHNLHVKAVISELPVPPTVPASGHCTNPAGCVSGDWGALGSPGFFWDPRYVLLGVNYAGAPKTRPASIYSGPQVLLVKTDGTAFPDGNAWKCLTCALGLPVGSPIITADFTYPPPHALPGDTKVLVGNGILQCSVPSLVVSDPDCIPQIIPIYWNGSPLGAPTATSPFGNGREWRLSPDGVHLAWDSLFMSNGAFTEDEFEGTLQFDATTPRYNLIDVYFLPQGPPWVVEPGNVLKFQPRTMIGELRGWTSDGQSILGIQSYESDSIDAWATNLTTGDSQPLTDHAEYTDPNFMSPDGKWLLSEEVVGSGRLDFISGMPGIPPITDLLPTTGYVAGIRNNMKRRFFLPWLVNPARQQSEQINAGGDPNWNAAADPVWLADSTAVVWAENLACGANLSPPQCPDSTEPGGRNSRVMMARFPTLPPSTPTPPAPISDTAPAAWAVPYPPQPGHSLPTPATIPTGTYTIDGNVRGSATVTITDNSSSNGYHSITASFQNYSDNGRNVINGSESVQNDTTSAGNVTWCENLTLSGQRSGTKTTNTTSTCTGTAPTATGTFTLGLSVLFFNNFQATGTMTTTIDGQTYTQPANGT